MAKLFDPIAIRGMEVPNRIVMPSMTTRLAAPDGAVTPELIRYFVARAEGGAGFRCYAVQNAHRKWEVDGNGKALLPTADGCWFVDDHAVLLHDKFV